MTTTAPSVAKSLAMAAPTPELAPVTTATLFSSRFIASPFFVVEHTMLSTVAHAGTRELVASAYGKHVLGGWGGPSWPTAILSGPSFRLKTDHHVFVFGKKPGKCAGRAKREGESSLMLISFTPKETPPFFALGKEGRGKTNRI